MSDYVPVELVSEILSRLPAKSLLRFRCVCKQWFSLISNPSFTLKTSSSSLTHLVRHYSTLFSKEIYALYPDPSLVSPETRLAFPSSGAKCRFYPRVVGYRNGVLCLSDDFFGCNESIVLWNPSVRRAVNVPLPKVTTNLVGTYVFALGFGFDSVDNDYKVVRLAYLVIGNGYKVPAVVEVFSVNSGEWSHAKGKIRPFIVAEYFWSQAVRESVVHWFGFVACGEGRSLIVTFNLSRETFGEVSLPDRLISGSVCNTKIIMLEGLLSLLCYDKTSPVCDVWVMRDYGVVNSWVCRYNIHLEEDCLILGMPRKDELFMSSGNGELLLYNCLSARTETMGIRGTWLSFFVDKYVESLALLGKGREVRGRDPNPDYEDEDELVEKEEYQSLRGAFMNVLMRIMNTKLT